MSCFAGNRPESMKWYKVYEWTTFADVASFAYTIDNSATTPTFTRILYQMCLGNYAVWCEMDDFTSGNALRVGVPLTWFYETDVNNLKVYVNGNSSSYPGASPSTIYSRESVLGRINFWPSNYDTTGGNSALYDHDDDVYSTSNGYGCMQVFDMIPTTPECIFAWNAWGLTNGGDLGMGNRSVSHPDWTFAYNLNSIGPRFARVYVK